MKNKNDITIWILGVIIITLGLFIGYLLNNPKIVIEEKEVPVEIIVEKEVVVEIEKEVIVETEKIIEVEIEPTYAHNVTSEEREMLARLLYREGNTESTECQRAIVSVIINRWLSGLWGSTLQEVVYAQNQFTPASMIPCTTPNEANYEVVDYVLKNGVTIPEYVMYFRLDYHFSWAGYSAYKKLDNTCFGYMNRDKGE
jgi:hypothetical protein